MNLIVPALEIIDRALFESGATQIVPLLSGGHDSISACFVASQHPKFDGCVHHIDTGIGAKATRKFVEDLCSEQGWDLRIYKSSWSYEEFVSRNGFPGPGGHRFVYQAIKERCIRHIMRTKAPAKVVLLTGARSAESVRRMGHTLPVVHGERSFKTGKVREKRRIWTAPIHNWNTLQQRSFMEQHELPLNPIKTSPLGMSGECFCGAFARPYEIILVRRFAPDVAEEIDRLAVIAKANGKPCVWGQKPKHNTGQLEFAWSGPLCTSCDQRAAASGFILNGSEQPTAGGAR